jgi:hypothetical protein
MLIKGYINQPCGETPTNLRMGVPTLTTNFASLTVTHSETQRKIEFNSTNQTTRDASELEDLLEAQPQRFAVLRINADSHNGWDTYQFYGSLNMWWLNRKPHAIPNSFDFVVVEIRKTSMLPNIRGNAINALLGLHPPNSIHFNNM